jgi:hypothetical protein
MQTFFTENFNRIFKNKKCQCCLEGGGQNKGCGAENEDAKCTVYGTNPAGTGAGTCSYVSGTNNDSFVRFYFLKINLYL